MRRPTVVAVLAAMICALPFLMAASVAHAQPTDIQLLLPSQTVMIEHEDRKNRLLRLSRQEGILAPKFYEYMITPAEHRLADYPISLPVLRVVFRDEVFFDFDKDAIKPEADSVIETIAASLQKEPPDVSIFIAGHTDDIGSADYNLQLGLRRSRAVAARLVELGVNQVQIYVISFGKAVPLASNANANGRAKNRRVEFLFAARPQPIAAWLATQKADICGSAGGAAPNECSIQYSFRGESVEAAAPIVSVHAPSNPVLVAQKPKVTSIAYGRHIVDIDLRAKVFSFPPPE